MSKPEKFPEQEQKRQPGREHKMQPEPEIIRKGYKGSDKLLNKKALITGGDSGIGRAVALHFAREGADVAIIYKEEDKDARETQKLIEKEGRKGLLFEADIKSKEQCEKCINDLQTEWDTIDILINNAAMQFPKNNLEEISEEQLKTTFETNIYPMFYLTQLCLPFMKENSCIINTTSITAFRGSQHLLDYSSTKGAIQSYTRSLSQNLVGKGIRVNAVAPGPIWTPLIPSSFNDVAEFGTNTPMGRAGQPSEVAPAYVFLASADSSYITGQVIHVNGGAYLGN
jgi:NAD(P)-dependent dehydrogenase (short-subunit alcohol dehydrogenase family)